MAENKTVTIKGYSNYTVSTDGTVMNIKKNKIVTPWKQRGYMIVGLSNCGKVKHMFLHRLVATAFIPNPDNLPFINHKDEDKTNNCVDNLEWCDTQYNNTYGTRIKRMLKTKYGR